jgi:hypothetical protein
MFLYLINERTKLTDCSNSSEQAARTTVPTSGVSRAFGQKKQNVKYLLRAGFTFPTGDNNAYTNTSVVQSYPYSDQACLICQLSNSTVLLLTSSYISVWL